VLAAQIQYWLLAVIVLCSLGFFCYAFVKANTTQEKKVSEMVMGLGLCGALCCLVSARLPALLWVQWDEVQLLRTSAAMHFHRFNGYLEQALPGGSRLLPEV
jgi:hypothetical protein